MAIIAAALLAGCADNTTNKENNTATSSSNNSSNAQTETLLTRFDSLDFQFYSNQKWDSFANQSPPKHQSLLSGWNCYHRFISAAYKI